MHKKLIGSAFLIERIFTFREKFWVDSTCAVLGFVESPAVRHMGVEKGKDGDMPVGARGRVSDYKMGLTCHPRSLLLDSHG